MTFEFQFQRVLEVRELEEKQEQAKLGEIQQRWIKETRRLQTLKDSLEDLYQRARESSRGESVKMGVYLQYQQSARNLQTKIQSQRKVVEEWENKVNDQRDQLIEASRRREMMETLKENQREEYEKKRRRDRQNRLNEVSARQFYRKHRTSD